MHALPNAIPLGLTENEKMKEKLMGLWCCAVALYAVVAVREREVKE